MARRTEDDMSSGDEVVTEASPCMEEEGVGGGPQGLYNGCLVLTVSTGSACWDPRFEYDHCREMLAQHGLQVPPEDLELPLRRALGSPEVRRFLFFNSTLFLTLLAPVLYLVIWCILFSSFHLLGTPFSQNYFAAICLALSAAAVVITGAIVLVLNHYHGKISVNMEVRLTQANELLRRHHLLVGLSDRMKNCTSQLFLNFCYFGVSECLKRLTDLLDREHESNRDLQRKIKRKFGSLCVAVIQDSVRPQPRGSRDECVDSEETPLLEAERDMEPGRPLPATPSSLACCMAPVGPPQHHLWKVRDRRQEHLGEQRATMCHWTSVTPTTPVAQRVRGVLPVAAMWMQDLLQAPVETPWCWWTSQGTFPSYLWPPPPTNATLSPAPPKTARVRSRSPVKRAVSFAPGTSASAPVTPAALSEEALTVLRDISVGQTALLNAVQGHSNKMDEMNAHLEGIHQGLFALQRSFQVLASSLTAAFVCAHPSPTSCPYPNPTPTTRTCPKHTHTQTEIPETVHRHTCMHHIIQHCHNTHINTHRC